VLDVDAGASELEDLRAEWLVGGEIKFLFAVVAAACGGHGAGLQAIGTDGRAGFFLADEEVIALLIKGVGIQSAFPRRSETLAELNVENFVAQTLCGHDVLRALGEVDTVGFSGVNCAHRIMVKRFPMGKHSGIPTLLSHFSVFGYAFWLPNRKNCLTHDVQKPGDVEGVD
jgi:hypothetical protein